jgi:hypothetical protein
VEVVTGFKKRVIAALKEHWEVLKQHAGRDSDDDKGNFELRSLDGTFKIAYRNDKIGQYDERSTQAEGMIRDFITDHVKEPAVLKLIEIALGRKNGKLDPNQVRKLQQMRNDFDDERWQRGLQLLDESFVVIETKTYVNFYKKDAEGKLKLMSLEFSSLDS